MISMSLYYSFVTVFSSAVCILIGLIVANKQRNAGGLAILIGFWLVPFKQFVLNPLILSGDTMIIYNIINNVFFFLSIILIIVGAIMLPKNQTQ